MGELRSASAMTTLPTPGYTQPLHLAEGDGGGDTACGESCAYLFRRTLLFALKLTDLLHWWNSRCFSVALL